MRCVDLDSIAVAKDSRATYQRYIVVMDHMVLPVAQYSGDFSSMKERAPKLLGGNTRNCTHTALHAEDLQARWFSYRIRVRIPAQQAICIDIVDDIDLMPALHQDMRQLPDVIGISTEMVRRVERGDHREAQSGPFHSIHHKPDCGPRGCHFEYTSLILHISGNAGSACSPNYRRQADLAHVSQEFSASAGGCSSSSSFLPEIIAETIPPLYLSVMTTAATCRMTSNIST